MGKAREEAPISERVSKMLSKVTENPLFLLGLLGVAVLLALQLLGAGKPATPTPAPAVPVVNPQSVALDKDLEQIVAYRKQLEQQLSELLGGIHGIDKVSVMLALESAGEAVPAMNVQSTQKTTEESDSAGGTRLTKEESRSDSLAGMSNELLFLQEKLPPITGVVVVAQGAEDAALRLVLTEAVTIICNVPAHKVQVLPGK